MSGAGVTLAAYGVLSTASFALYGFDKLQAKRSGRRVPEAQLHTLGLLGGFPGAFLGMRVFRHKTGRPSFSAALLVAALLHGAAWAWALSR